MTSTILAGLLLSMTLGSATLQGQVVGPDSAPIPNAQVFLEPGLGGALRDTIASDTGRFTFEQVPAGPAGVFAVAPGFGFEGRHVRVAVGDKRTALTIMLHEASEIRGVVVDPAGDPVEGARITRMGVKGAHKVGVPLAKLRQYGYSEPVSDSGGAFVLESIPTGATLDLKVGHPRFAQEGVLDVPAGERAVRITLYPGELVEGSVVARDSGETVGQAAVLLRNAQPPHDTSTTRSDLRGNFSVRLKPGVYLYRAQGAGLRSPGWERLVVTGEAPTRHVRIAVAGTGSIRGQVRDAVSGEPVHGVRVSLTTSGTRAATTRTGPGGDFLFTAGAGENVVRIEATPGYFPPEIQQVKVTVTEGKQLELPGMWLKPLPAYEIQVVDGDGTPVPGALVTVLRPRQFGWHEADQEGKVAIRVRQLPEDGMLVGRAEHPSLPQAALFTLDRSREPEGTVQLFEVGTVTGRVINARGRGLAGASVGAFFPGETGGDAVMLWQTYSEEDGQFQWDAVVPGVPQRCAARTGAEAETGGESATFNLAPGEQKSLGDLAVRGGENVRTRLGETIRWDTWELLCGALPDEAARLDSPAMLVFASAENAPVYLESLARMRELLSKPDLHVVLVVEGAPDCADAPLPVVSGAADGGGAILLLDRAGRVVLETDQIPPVQLLKKL